MEMGSLGSFAIEHDAHSRSTNPAGPAWPDTLEFDDLVMTMIKEHKALEEPLTPTTPSTLLSSFIVHDSNRRVFQHKSKKSPLEADSSFRPHPQSNTVLKDLSSRTVIASTRRRKERTPPADYSVTHLGATPAVPPSKTFFIHEPSSSNVSLTSPTDTVSSWNIAVAAKHGEEDGLAWSLASRRNDTTISTAMPSSTLAAPSPGTGAAANSTAPGQLHPDVWRPGSARSAQGSDRSASPLLSFWSKSRLQQTQFEENLVVPDGAPRKSSSSSNNHNHHNNSNHTTTGHTGLSSLFSKSGPAGMVGESSTSSRRLSQSGAPPPTTTEEFLRLPVAIQRKVRRLAHFLLVAWFLQFVPSCCLPVVSRLCVTKKTRTSLPRAPAGQVLFCDWLSGCGGIGERETQLTSWSQLGDSFARAEEYKCKSATASLRGY